MDSDVIVIGAGPVGLVLACELARGGVSVIVVDRLSEPDRTAKANGLVGQIVPALQRREYLRRIRGVHPVRVSRFPFGPLSVRLGRLRGRLPVFPLPQRRLEDILTQRAEELGVVIRRGIEFTHFDEAEDSVVVHCGAVELRAGYVVGCDGARSRLRKVLGVDFDGVTSEEIARLGHITIRSEDAAFDGRLLSLRTGQKLALIQPNHTERGSVTITPARRLDREAPSDEYIVAVTMPRSEADREAEMTTEELQDSLRLVLGFEIPISAGHSLRRTIANSRQAARYRVGRAFLAGDAAHIFSAGGAALNTGMLDALDLADRLVAVIGKSAATSVLDGYETTRHPAGHRALIQTRAQAALNAVSPEGAALREVFAGFTSRNPRRYLSELLSGD